MAKDVIQRQMAFQKAISQIPSQAGQISEYDNLADSLKRIVREKAELTCNRIERDKIREKYKGEPKLIQENIEPTYADDNRHCKNINNAMMEINQRCEQFGIEPIFPMARKDYVYDTIEKAATEYVQAIDAIDELSHQPEKEHKFGKDLPRKETNKTREDIIDDIIDDINKENRRKSGPQPD